MTPISATAKPLAPSPSAGAGQSLGVSSVARLASSLAIDASMVANVAGSVAATPLYTALGLMNSFVQSESQAAALEAAQPPAPGSLSVYA